MSYIHVACYCGDFSTSRKGATVIFYAPTRELDVAQFHKITSELKTRLVKDRLVPEPLEPVARYEVCDTIHRFGDGLTDTIGDLFSIGNIVLTADSRVWCNHCRMQIPGDSIYLSKHDTLNTRGDNLCIFCRNSNPGLETHYPHTLINNSGFKNIRDWVKIYTKHTKFMDNGLMYDDTVHYYCNLNRKSSLYGKYAKEHSADLGNEFNLVPTPDEVRIFKDGLVQGRARKKVNKKKTTKTRPIVEVACYPNDDSDGEYNENDDDDDDDVEEVFLFYAPLNKLDEERFCQEVAKVKGLPLANDGSVKYNVCDKIKRFTGSSANEMYRIGQLSLNKKNRIWCKKCNQQIAVDGIYFSKHETLEPRGENLCKRCYDSITPSQGTIGCQEREQYPNKLINSTGLINIRDWVEIYSKTYYYMDYGERCSTAQQFYCNLNRKSPFYGQYATINYRDMIGDAFKLVQRLGHEPALGDVHEPVFENPT